MLLHRVTVDRGHRTHPRRGQDWEGLLIARGSGGLTRGIQRATPMVPQPQPRRDTGFKASTSKTSSVTLFASAFGMSQSIFKTFFRKRSAFTKHSQEQGVLVQCSPRQMHVWTEGQRVPPLTRTNKTSRRSRQGQLKPHAHTPAKPCAHYDSLQCFPLEGVWCLTPHL